jgi:methionine aminopeptidase
MSQYIGASVPKQSLVGEERRRGPFGHYICTSVNDAVLHGLPHDYTLADGDR